MIGIVHEGSGGAFGDLVGGAFGRPVDIGVGIGGDVLVGACWTAGQNLVLGELVKLVGIDADVGVVVGACWPAGQNRSGFATRSTGHLCPAAHHLWG